MSSTAANNLLSSVINNTGVIEADALENKNGIIKLTGGRIIQQGRIAASGGDIEIKADFIGLGGDIIADGNSGGRQYQYSLKRRPFTCRQFKCRRACRRWRRYFHLRPRQNH